ncbi:MAG: type II secretion system F family protein [Candidatus Omnitrophota bacterium]|nr:type II secretion system F family protein [Candidatus Omnitrophota bacterium]
MDILIYLLIILALGLIVWSLVLSQQGRSTRLPPLNVNLKRTRPHILLSSILPTRGLLEKTGIFARIKRKIDAGHLNISPEGFFNLKILIMAVLAALTPVALGKVDPIYILVALVIGYIAPEFYLRQRIAKRKYQIVRRLPETVDLLGLCIEAGLDFSSAVRWVIDKTPPTPINEEFSLVLEEIKWGKPRIQALKDMSSRLDIPEVSSFVQTIIQAERMGSPVAEVFTILSEDVRLQRFHRGERIALQAPIKILLPLIFFIMPVIGIIIGGPIFLQFTMGKMIPGF